MSPARKTPVPFPLGPLLAIVAGAVLTLVLSAGFTVYEVGAHSRQACPELHAQAFSGPATLPPYEEGVRQSYRAIWKLRCT